MCTVTIVPKGEHDFILTSNRDEAPNRESLPPEFYNIKDTSLLFPKDKVSGGTWIGISDKNRVVCVLNGGFIRHKRKPIYKKSRGLVAKDFLIFKTLTDKVEAYDYQNIEPFTMVLADWNAGLKFYELIWDGITAHFTELPLEPKLWSSTTLYSQTMKEERLDWFRNFKATQQLNDVTLLKFHKTAGNGNKDYGVIMNRGFVKTTSITQIEKQKRVIDMRYENLQNQSIYQKTFNLSPIVNE
ncbi:NRDE family protein [Aestuariivivens sediminis]|uniref:NRDE family protein n=1 Tax=Aestuariivivens sediminis TaxID=2913557 RepID=UPI001F5920CA|nr:NRDE family protein [Aestuariivivens sediminis]